MFTTFGLVEGLAMSPEVGDNREILAYFLFMLRALLLSTCGGVADLSSQGGIAIAIICLCQTIVFENRFVPRA